MSDGMVHGLRVVPHGPTYRFDDHVDGRLLVGKYRCCDIQLTDDAVSGVHCIIDRCDPMRVTVLDCLSDSGTWLNGARIIEGELHEGTLLSVGATTLVAVGAHGSADRVLMAAATMQDFLVQAIDTYGSVRQAAHAIGVPRSTLDGWIRTEKFELARAATSKPVRGTEEEPV